MPTLPLFLALSAALAAAAVPPAAAQTVPLQPCRLEAVATGALCGSLQRPLDPTQPGGTQITLHFAVLPAVARNKKPDPVFFFAGGPGQSAIALAGQIDRQMARLGNRRDVVLIDQRGTGRSAPLQCDDEGPTASIAAAASPQQQRQRLRDCLAALQALPHGDLRHYTTPVAMADADAVRQALGVAQVNLVGGSYGTRAALEYMRQFPQAVRRVVIDGVAPPDMALPASFSTDSQTALDAVLAACEAEAACIGAYPALRSDWAALLASLPREVSLAHPVTGVSERLELTRELLLGLVRPPLYAPAMASALPLAITQAAQGRFEPLLTLGLAVGGGPRSTRLAAGMHFSVVCAEDLPRLSASADAPGADFGTHFADLYRDVCSTWPRGELPADFYRIAAAPAATLVLSGGADPATPPRHGQRVADALGAKARHVLVAQAGHGVLPVPCMRDLLFRFIDAASDADALALPADCAQAIPRPGAFVPPGAAAVPLLTGSASTGAQRPPSTRSTPGARP